MPAERGQYIWVILAPTEARNGAPGAKFRRKAWTNRKFRMLNYFPHSRAEEYVFLTTQGPAMGFFVLPFSAREPERGGRPGRDKGPARERGAPNGRAAACATYIAPVRWEARSAESVSAVRAERYCCVIEPRGLAPSLVVAEGYD